MHKKLMHKKKPYLQSRL